MMTSFCVSALVLGVVLLGPTGAFTAGPNTARAGQAPEPVAAWGGDLTEHLGRALHERDERTQATLVRALRQLRDPELAPLFARLSISGSGAVKGQAVLALAQLQPEAGLDLMVVRRMSPPEQASVLAEGLSEGLLLPGQLADLLRWDELPPTLFCAVAGRMIEAGQPVDPARLRAMTGSEHVGTAAVASILLRQGGAADSASGTIDQLLAAKGSEARRDLRIVLQLIRDRALSKAVDIPARVLAERADDPLLCFEATAATLVADPQVERAAGVWQRRFESASDAGDRARYALAALQAVLDRRDPATGSELAARVARVLKASTVPMIVAMGEAVSLVAEQGDGAEATAVMDRLARFENPPALAWILRRAARFKPELARSVREAVINAVGASETVGVGEPVMEAARALASDEPQALCSLLMAAHAKGSVRTTSRLLEGALRSNMAGLACAPTTAWPDQRTAGLAAVLRARATGGEVAVDPATEQALARVAGGEGDLPEGLRIQAAWLALRHARAGQAALARVLVNVDEGP